MDKLGYDTIRKFWYFPNMGSWWRENVKECRTCIRRKALRLLKNKKADLRSIPAPVHNWEHVHVDLCGPFPPSKNGNIYVWIAICRRSGHIKAEPLPSKKAEDTARVLKHRVL